MINIILNVVGIIIVIYATILIIKDNKSEFKKEDINLDSNNKFLEEVETFNKVLENKLNDSSIEMSVKTDNTQSLNLPYYKIRNNIETSQEKTIEDVKYGGIIKDEKKNLYNTSIENSEVIKLKENGYSNNDIAKKTGRSIREIDIILKMHD